MAEDKKASFPMMPVKSWWTLRERFKKTIPVTVTENYLATSLGIATNSARDNVLRPLKQIGIINEEGKPQEIAKQWRDDQDYASACQIIRQRIYPQELFDTFPEPDESPEAIERWFRNHSGVGESAAGKQAAFYMLLAQADVSKANDAIKNVTNGVGNKAVPKPHNKIKVAQQRGKNENTSKQEEMPNRHQPTIVHPSIPSLHIDVQIHISPETSAEQIDKIFESMAKHLQSMKSGGLE